MGLSPDIKPFIRKQYAEAFVRPEDAPDLQLVVTDCMYTLYQFTSQAGELATGEDLVDFFFDQATRLMLGAGSVVVFCFDCPQHVPNAKSNTQAKRRRQTQAQELTVSEISDSALHAPYWLALTKTVHRNAIIEYVIAGIHRRARAAIGDWHVRAFQVVTQWHDVRVTASPAVPTESVQQLTSLPVEMGEADVAVAFWVRHFDNLSALVRVQDSDHIMILLLNLDRLKPGVPRFLWHVSLTGHLSAETCSAPACPGRGRAADSCALLGRGRFDLIDLARLAAGVAADYVSVDTFALLVIMQKTDFVDKLIAFSNVENVLRQAQFMIRNHAPLRQRPLLERDPVSGRTALCTESLARLLQGLAAQFRGGTHPVPLRFGKKNTRVALHPAWETEAVRAHWNLAYWRAASDSHILDPMLDPTRRDSDTGKFVHGWDENGQPVHDKACLENPLHA